ncbi:Ro-like RNA binding protein [Microbacterium phage FuzzBuster]|uniref:Ro-like RNA binding protein n=1 Tax=Microbacterium phage FuzzBuster TaxID=2590935 RepID=A0A516KV57_9CAUD|nr:Ro-like RNA binding protein [Microbacterium phage FuzzBuster]
MGDIYASVGTRQTPQSEQADPRQVKNNAGGFTFEVDDLARAKRFLILGSDAGTYYQQARELTIENAGIIQKLALSRHRDLVDLIVDVSSRGLAPRQQPALFALAIAASVEDPDARKYALDKLALVARTASTLFTFTKYVQNFRGWSRGMRSAFSRWYIGQDVDRLAYQMVKYRSRDGWTHNDLLRRAHPSSAEPARRALFEWAKSGNAEGTPAIVEGFIKAQEQGADHAALIEQYRLPWEALPDEALTKASTWQALLDNQALPVGAVVRQLGRLTRLGVLDQMRSDYADVVAGMLTSTDTLKRARMHPLQLLVALKTYAQGRGVRGSETWTPVSSIIDALDAGFYAAFGAVEPAGKRTMFAVDVSGSMGMFSDPSGILTAREVSAAMALVGMATEPGSSVFGFSHDFRPLDISPRRRLDDAIRTISNLPFGHTDCALPMVEALRHGWEVDTFVIITDNETWHGAIHPHQALQQYRRVTGIDAKLIVMAVTATPFTIADPSDAGMLDVVGFGTDVPQLVTEFSRGI